MGELRIFLCNVYITKTSVFNAFLFFLEEERGQKRKRELDEEGEEDEDD